MNNIAFVAFFGFYTLSVFGAGFLVGVWRTYRECKENRDAE